MQQIFEDGVDEIFIKEEALREARSDLKQADIRNQKLNTRNKELEKKLDQYKRMVEILKTQK